MRFALALPTDAAARLQKTARRFGHEVVTTAADALQLVGSLDAARPDAVLALAEPQLLSAGVLQQCDARGIRVLAVVESDFHRRQARELGLFETVALNADWPQIDEQFMAPAAVETVARAHRGRVVGVWGPSGSPGRTSIAVGVAFELAAAGYTVALADADPHSASIAPALGMLDEAPGFAAACRLAGSDSLSARELERIGQRYESADCGFWVLTGLGQPSRWPELSASRVTATIEHCRDWVDFTVLDTGFSLDNDEEISSDLLAPRRNAATITALRECDQVIAVGAADPVGMSRFLRAHGDLLELASPERITVVMNKLRASAIGLNPAGQVQQTLARFGSIDAPVLVPWDQPGLDAALLSGRALAEISPRSPARLAVQQLVRTRILRDRDATAPAPAQRSGRRSRRAARLASA
ncbi:MAG: AAA family ATPase [Microbacteriaceae bacterium]